MEDKPLTKAAMVSRLPKFGGRSSVGGTSPLSNGSTQPTTPNQDCKTTHSGTRPNGVIHASPFPLKWKRDEGTTLPSSTTLNSSGEGYEDKAQPQLTSLAKDIKSGPPATPKLQRPGSSMLAVSSSKGTPKKSVKMSPKVGSKLDQSPMNGGPKLGNGNSSIPGGTGYETYLVRPRLGSSSPRSNSQDSLSQASDSQKNMALDNMVRSNSFTHFKQIPSPTSQPMTRSFSFNRAVELAKPLANTQLRPPRSTFLKPPQLSNGRMGLGLSGPNGDLGGSGGLLGVPKNSKTPPAASSLPTLSTSPSPITPSSLRKHLLPSCMLTKSFGSTAGSLGYRLTRCGQAKQQKPLFPQRAKSERPSAVPECRELLGIAIDTEPTVEAEKTNLHSDSDGSSGGGGSKGGASGVVAQSSVQPGGETLEDMSLSSASSLDKADNSEEFVDDFYGMGNVLSDGDLPDDSNTSNTSNTSNSTQTQSLHNETLDWDNMDLEGHTEESPMEDSQGPLFFSLNLSDVLQASSVELSPSNSSAGTYMWDEDGLEPLAGLGTHLCDSYDDSELNSQDILNNLEPPGTGELDDDDLMLDMDLPEDGFHDADRMSHTRSGEKANQQGQRRKHRQWIGQGPFHNESRAHVLQPFDGPKPSRISSPSVCSEGRQHGYMAMLDELTLDHMTLDCSSLKNQLLRLKTLLQVEDANCPPDVPVEIDNNTTTSQVEELIKEVQVLKAELKSRDKTIAQLTLQCQKLQQYQREEMQAQSQQLKCHCHSQNASSLRHSDRRMDKRIQHHYDKATQTYWKPVIHAGVLPTLLLSPWQAQHQGLTRTSMPQRRQRVEHLVQYFYDTAWYSNSFFNKQSTCCPNNPTLARWPQILQRFKPFLSEHLRQGKPVKTPPTEGHNDLRTGRPEEQTLFCADSSVEDVMADVSRPANPNKPSPLISTHLHCPGVWALQGVNARESPTSAPAVIPRNSVTPRSASSSCPRMLQPLRLHKDLSLPALKPGGTGGFSSPKQRSSFGPQNNQLPPPSRGLPSFNAGHQVQLRSLDRTSQLQPRRTSRASLQGSKGNQLQPGGTRSGDAQRPQVSQDPDPFELPMPPQAKDSPKILNPPIKASE